MSTAPSQTVRVDQEAANGTAQASAGALELEKRYALGLSDRVKSIKVDPLHSTAYLTYLAKYLKTPFQKPPKRPHVAESPSSVRRSFVVRYLLRPNEAPSPESFDDPRAFSRVASPSSQNEILFLTGRPSADWLNCLGSTYSLDYRFFHQHLGPIMSSQAQGWIVGPDLPSRSLQLLTLKIPTVVRVGSRGRNFDIRELEIAREKCNAQLQKAFLSVQDSVASEVGRSIIRRLEVQDGNTMVVEQQVTATVVRRGDFWTIILWNDAGSEVDCCHIPVPPTKAFTPVASDVDFYPVFFDNQHTQQCESGDATGDDNPPLMTQPLALLNKRYGATIDWSACPTDSPLAVLQELFVFKAAAALQYLNMLDHVLQKVGGLSEFPSFNHTKLETTVQYDYIKSSLSRLEQHCSEVVAFLQNPPTPWKADNGGVYTNSETITDFNYLISRTKSLIKVCEDEKATLMSNNAVQAAKRSAMEASLVTRLTKATNRVTFIFLPISFVTSIFGMNFKQLGQGSLPIWIWAVITVPLLIASIVIVERGHWIRIRWRDYRQRRRLAKEKEKEL